MKKLCLLASSVLLGVAGFAQQYQPEKGDITNILQKNSSFTIDLNFDSPLPTSGDQGIPYGENPFKGCVADFNGDGIDDFIVTGLHWVDQDVRANMTGFLRVYYGQSSGTPLLAYKNDNFTLVGNGAIDCTKLSDGVFLVAVQGGTKGNWAPPYAAEVFKLTAGATSATFQSMDATLDYGSGRGSILFLDVNGDGFMDIFQLGWITNEGYPSRASIYLNDGTNEWWVYQTDNCGIRPAANTFAFAYDMNKDGKTDIIFPIQAGNYANNDPRGVMVYYNNGDGTFTEYQAMNFYAEDRADGFYFRAEDDLNQIQLVDYNHDGWMDIVVSSTLDNKGDVYGGWVFPVIVLKNNGDGTFEELPFMNDKGAILMGGQRGDWAAADFDGDGIVDLIGGFENQYRPDDASGAWSSRTYFYKGDKQGGFTETDITLSSTNATGIPAMCRRGNFGRMLCGDFNGDRQPDLLTFGAPYTNSIRTNYANLYLNVVEDYQHGSGIGGIISSDASINVYDNKVVVSGAAGQKALVYSITGVLVQSETLGSDNVSFTVNAPAGLYIVKVASLTQKAIIK